MKQFILPDGYKGGSFFNLTGKEFHYLIRVLRIKESESFSGMDNRGNSYKITVKDISRDSCRLDILENRKRKDHSPRITLFQCLPKGRKMDLIIRQATEIGISNIIPIKSSFTVSSISESSKDNKIARWERIAREAAQQSGSFRMPEIMPPIVLSDLSKIWNNNETGIFFHHEPLENNTLHRYLFECSQNISIVIGPEGGLAKKETVFLKNTGFKPVYLGSNILRTETAAIYALSAIHILLLEKKAWKLSSL